MLIVMKNMKKKKSSFKYMYHQNKTINPNTHVNCSTVDSCVKAGSFLNHVSQNTPNKIQFRPLKELSSFS